MRGHRLAPLLLGLAGGACGSSVSAEPQWVQWFSDREILDMAVSPAGEAVVVGRSTSDERVAVDPHAQATWRPWIARIAADGTLLDDWTGFHGYAHAVAVDAEGRAYVALGALRNDQDWSVPERCELRALDRDGQVRWSRASTGSECPVEVEVAGDAVVVKTYASYESQRIEALELDGRPRWQRPADAAGVLAVHGDAVWVGPSFSLVDLPELEAVAWRLDARDGGMTEVRLDLGDRRFPGHFVATADGLLVSSVPPGYSSGAPRFLASFTLDGRRRWEHEVVPPTIGLDSEVEQPTWSAFWGQPIADGSAVWFIGGEHLFEPYETRTTDRFRMMLQRWSADGAHEGTLRHAFEDPDDDPAVVARSECPASEDALRPVLGSLATDAVVRPDGALLVAGRQGCRDAFLVSLGVAR